MHGTEYVSIHSIRNQQSLDHIFSNVFNESKLKGNNKNPEDPENMWLVS